MKYVKMTMLLCYIYLVALLWSWHSIEGIIVVASSLIFSFVMWLTMYRIAWPELGIHRLSFWIDVLREQRDGDR